MLPLAYQGYEVPGWESLSRLSLADLRIERQIINDCIEDYEAGNVSWSGWCGGGQLSWYQIEAAQNYNRLAIIDKLIEDYMNKLRWKVLVTPDLNASGEILVSATSVKVTASGDLVFAIDDVLCRGIGSGYWIDFTLIGESTTGGER